MKIHIKNLENIDIFTKERVIHNILTSRHVTMSWIKNMLRLLNIQGRTAIYKAYQSPFIWNTHNSREANESRFDITEAQETARLRAVENIANTIDINRIVQLYIHEVTIHQLAMTIAEPLGGLLDLQIILEGIQTN